MGSTFRYVTFPFSSSASILYTLAGLLSRPIPRNPDCTQPSVSRFVGSIQQRPPSPPPHPPSSLRSVFFLVWPPIFHVSLRLRVAPLFSIGTFSRGGSGGIERVNNPRGCHVRASSEKVAAPLAEVAFSFDSLSQLSRSAAPDLAAIGQVSTRAAPIGRGCDHDGTVRAESAPLRGERTIAAIK